MKNTTKLITAAMRIITEAPELVDDLLEAAADFVEGGMDLLADGFDALTDTVVDNDVDTDITDAKVVNDNLTSSDQTDIKMAARMGISMAFAKAEEDGRNWISVYEVIQIMRGYTDAKIMNTSDDPTRGIIMDLLSEVAYSQSDPSGRFERWHLTSDAVDTTTAAPSSMGDIAAQATTMTTNDLLAYIATNDADPTDDTDSYGNANVGNAYRG